MHYRYHDSPLGPLFIAADDSGLQLLLMELDSRPWRIEDDWQPAGRELDAVCSQLDQYFAGQRRHFELRLAPRGTARCRPSPTAVPAATRSWPESSSAPRRCGRSAPPTAPTRSRSSCPAIG